MTQFESLIQHHCPEGVKWVKLGECFTRIKGTPITAGTMKEIATKDGDIRIFAGGKTIVNAFEKDIPDANITRVPAVLVQSRGVIDFIYYDKPFTFKNEMWAYTHTESTTLKYLYYYCKNNLSYFKDAAAGMGSMPQISLPVTQDFLIPLPPLPIQEKIVEILDKFSLLSAELEAELEGRRKQYEYYRTRLLSFDSDSDTVVWKTLGEVCNSIATGKLNANAQEEDGIYPFFTCDAEPFKINTYAFDTEAILVSGNGSQVGHINYYNGKFNAYQRTYVLSNFSSEINIPYLLQYFKGTLREYIFKNCKKGSVPYITLPMLQDFSIPIPPLAEQERIVTILDKFEALVTDLSQGLPAEIQKVQQQYEYYRNLLLNFEMADQIRL